MKKLFYIIIATLGIFGTTSCEDMLESDSSRQLFDPTLSEKTDSVFYAYGIMQAMQQLADQYYFQNEMRGELVKPTAKASLHLRNLAQFSNDTSNKYDSVYLYYKVINNCNYYLAHRDTTLMTGKEKVAINEFAGVASFRAWAYLQLTRQYGAVPYLTEPVTTIAQINANTAATDYRTILAAQAEYLEQLKASYTEEQLAVPTFGQAQRSIGVLNWTDNGRTVTKYLAPNKCFIPLNVVLGDLYLELGRYEEAATCYYQYLRYAAQQYAGNVSVNYTNQMRYRYSDFSPIFKDLTEANWPADFNETQNATLGGVTWESSFQNAAAPGDVISYIPMSVNYTMGKTTDIPAVYGYNYYGAGTTSTVRTNSTVGTFNCPKTEDIQIVPSQVYCDSARNAQYYYYTEMTTTAPQYWIVKNQALGDARARIVSQGIGADTACVYTYKPSTGYVYLYRSSTVWLHLAEAINRMGYPDAAFAILKNGYQTELKNFLYEEVYLKDSLGNDSLDVNGNKILDTTLSHVDDTYYLTPESYELLTTTLPFLAQENSEIFRNGAVTAFVGIHFHGAGAVADRFSTYRYSTVLKAKLDDINTKFGLGLTEYTKDDYINAMEDLLCDEYAMEFAFEGSRFSDLRRLALHKNQAGLYGGNFGDTWLSTKLQNNAAGITTQNCYLPFQ